MGWYVPRRAELAPATFVVCSWTARPTGRHRLVPAPLGDNLRQPGVFGPARDVPDDADEQVKLLAFAGRAA